MYSVSTAIIFAVAYALLTALTAIGDRYLYSDTVSNPGAMLFTSKVSTMVLAGIIGVVWVVDIPESTTVITLIIVIGLIKAIPLYQYFRVVQQADASIVTPIVGTQPIVIVIFGFVLLGERLSMIEYVGLAFIICGTLLLMVTRFIDSWVSFGSLRGNLILNQHAVWAYILAIVWSTEAVFLKLVLNVEGILTVFVWTSVVSGLITLPFLLRKSVRDDLSEIRNASGKQLSIYTVGEFLSAIAWFFAIAAYANAPISLIGPVLHTYSVWVFIFVILIHLAGPTVDDELTGKNMKWKAFATVSTVFGIAIVYVV